MGRQYLSCASNFPVPAFLLRCHFCVSIHCEEDCSDISTALVACPGVSVLYQHSSGVSIAPVSALLRCQHNSGVSIALVSAMLWYQQISGQQNWRAERKVSSNGGDTFNPE
jgi:hypothetical protein